MAAWRAANPEKAKENQRRYYHNNPEGRKRTMLKRRYKLTLEQWQTLFTAQGERCAICKTTGTRGWCVDHHHGTGQVRGILCHPCNTAIGFMDDDPERLERAIAYLQK